MINDYTWVLAFIIPTLMFLGDIIYNTATLKQKINRNNDRLDDHSKRINKNDEGLNLKVAKLDCESYREKKDKDDKEWRDNIFSQLSRIESGVSEINGSPKKRKKKN